MPYSLPEDMPKARLGRSVRTNTPLGRLLVKRGLRKYEICYLAQIADRTMSEYLAGRKPFNARHLERLCHVLDCEPDDLTTGIQRVEPNPIMWAQHPNRGFLTIDELLDGKEVREDFDY